MTSFATAHVERPDLVDERGRIELWAVQRRVVFETMQRDGVAFVKKEYIQQKYGDTSWTFGEVYAWFRPRFEAVVARPDEAQSPYWLYRDPAWGVAGDDSVTIHLAIPADQVVLFDHRLWTRMLSFEYLGADESDEAAFADECAKWGIANSFDVFRTPLYPTMKTRVKNSWERLAGSARGCAESYLQGAVWELRRDWVI